jgi:hypothetical protein
MKTYCLLNGVTETLPVKRLIDNVDTVPKTFTTKADDQRVRLLNVLESISNKSRPERRAGREDPLTLPYYLVMVLLTAPLNELCDGLTRHHLLARIRELHRREDKTSIRMNDLVHLLKRLPVLQADNPAPFLYESNGKLKIADAGLLFALAKLDRPDLCTEILDPLEAYDDDDGEDVRIVTVAE